MRSKTKAQSLHLNEVVSTAGSAFIINNTRSILASLPCRLSSHVTGFVYADGTTASDLQAAHESIVAKRHSPHSAR